MRLSLRVLVPFVVLALALPAAAAISYGSPSFYTTVLGPTRVVVADFNGDCLPDFAAMNASGVTVDFGSGGGTFTHSADYSITSATAIAAGDFNEDGHADIVVANGSGANTLTILLNNGSGTFTISSTHPATGLGPNAMAAGDVNGDGHLDVVTANSDGTLSVLLGDGHGGFAAASNISVGVELEPNDMVLADLNGDGHLDAAIANGSNTLIFFGDGSGGFGAPTVIAGPASGIVRGIAAGDIDHDGRIDLATANGNIVGGASILHNDGGGSFSVTTFAMTASPTNPVSATLADLDGDGNLDLICATQNGCPPDGSNLAVRPGNGDGTFGGFFDVSVGYTNCVNSQFQPAFVAAVDLNCDGKADLIVPLANKSQVAVLLTSGASVAPPVGITAPANVSVSAGATCTAVVSDATLGTATTSGGCGGCLSATRSGVPAGNVFPLGTTTITYSVTDGHTSASATQTVTVTDDTPPAITAPAPITALCSGTIAITPPVATDNCGSATVTGVRSDSQPLSAAFPIGTTTITWTATDAHGNSSSVTQSVTVSPSPIVISGATASPAVLWPVNHKMVDVAIAYGTSGGCGAVNCSITSITSSEPANFLGDGNTPADWQIVDAHHVRLRAERSGTNSGRTYTIAISCTDGSTTTVKTVVVTVPKAQ